MPFSSLNDPVDVARSLAAWEAAWRRIQHQQASMLDSPEAERARLRYIIGSLAPLALDEDELVERAVQRFSELSEESQQAQV